MLHLLIYINLYTKLLISVFRFNKSPLKGVKYLQEQGLLESSPSAVAEFISSDDRLDKVS